ncbi:MAG: DUF1343 domain-containing protein [Chitinophagaceae bacterium]|nr:DUF1343 domain-containing protein [Chitinophagaceae bacterium]
MKNYLLLFLLISLSWSTYAIRKPEPIVTGAEQTASYMHLLKNKRVALLVNQTSMIGSVHLVDTLLYAKINIVKIFAPEHGFRGTADAGEKVKSGIDTKTGLTITSMYGASKKPSKESMKGIDIVVFDIQDVGARFYTYISSMQYMMEACAETGITMLILDRPNPNGFYVDGPVLEKKYQSFVGMQRVPIVHGMTVAEYAQMLNGEKWLNQGKKCALKIISCKNYTHRSRYHVPIPPSPNLKTDAAILLYPSLCLFEGTNVSVGRGTETPFEVWGHPDFKNMDFEFTPVSMEGAKNPPLEGKVCYGMDLHQPMAKLNNLLKNQMNLDFLIEAYKETSDTSKFFNSFFEKLAGTASLRKQIQQKVAVNDIRKSWQRELSLFKKTRKKYLLYPDFE